MSTKKQVKSRLHLRNKNRERYDLEALLKAKPELKNYLKLNKVGVESIDFSNPNVVKILNSSAVLQCSSAAPSLKIFSHVQL